MLAIPQYMAELARERPVFHSEADFQHALAWHIHSALPDARVRLERPIPNYPATTHLDLTVTVADRTWAVELKYKTRGVSTMFNGEHFKLRDQAAQDLARYDFLKDVQRLEQVRRGLGWGGTAVFLTNDSAYWKQPRDTATGYAEFGTHEGRSIDGVLRWGPRASVGTRRGREANICLAGPYHVRWCDYSDVLVPGYGRFRYLLLDVQQLQGTT